MIYPVNNFEDWYIASEFGEKQGVSYYHDGVDLNLKTGGNTDLGQPLLAIADYEVTSVHTNHIDKGFGNHIHIRIDGEWGTRYVHLAHCKDVFVKVGDVGKEGDKIATVGNTGNSTFAHCHFAIKKKATGIENVANSKEELEDGWEDPIVFIEKWIKEKNGQDLLDKLRLERDTNWNLYQEEKGKVGELATTIQEYLHNYTDMAVMLKTSADYPAIKGKIEGLLGVESDLTKANKKITGYLDEIEKMNKTIKENTLKWMAEKKSLDSEIMARGITIEALQEKPTTAPVATPSGKVYVEKQPYYWWTATGIILLLLVDIILNIIM